MTSDLFPDCKMDSPRFWHVTTERKAKKYRQSCKINAPVRGWTSLEAAMAWAMKTGRKVIYEVTPAAQIFPMPDHSNKYGRGVFVDADVSVKNIQCEYSAGESIHD